MVIVSYTSNRSQKDVGNHFSLHVSSPHSQLHGGHTPWPYIEPSKSPHCRSYLIPACRICLKFWPSAHIRWVVVTQAVQLVGDGPRPENKNKGSLASSAVHARLLKGTKCFYIFGMYVLTLLIHVCILYTCICTSACMYIYIYIYTYMYLQSKGAMTTAMFGARRPSKCGAPPRARPSCGWILSLVCSLEAEISGISYWPPGKP